MAENVPAGFMAVLSGLQKKAGGGGADFGKVKPGANFIRLYRHPTWEPGQVFYPRTSHWPFGGQQIMCTGEGCEKCLQVAKLFAAGDKDSRETAYQHRAQTRGIFAVVNVAEPTGVVLLELPEGATKAVMAAVAVVGGWTGPYPAGDPADEEAKKEMARFFKCLVEGVPHVCGPKGYDLGVTYTPKVGKKRAEYVVQLMPKLPQTKVLPFEESETPDIAEIMGRIEAKKAEKAQQ